MATLDISDIAGLRTSFQSFRKTGEGAWIRLDGLSLDDGNTHSALCHTLTRFALGAETGRRIPSIVVFDWSNVADCSAEGLAFFAVIAQHIAAMGVRVLVCGPAADSISEVLKQTGILSACASLTWVPCACTKGRMVKSLARAAFFGSDSNESIDVFCDELSIALKGFALPRATSRAVMGTTQELLHNVLSHANAQHAAAIALMYPRRRPKVLQIGIADDGVGIPGAVLRHDRHHWLQWFHDTSVTEVVLDRALSGRAGSPESGNGGGMARIIRRLLRETASTVMLRTAAALITLRSTAPERLERHALTFGAGTQVRLELQLS